MRDRARFVAAVVAGVAVFFAAPWLLAVTAVALGAHVGEGQP